MTAEEIQKFLHREFPQISVEVISCELRRAKVRLAIDQSHLRPGGTVSGPTMMLLADVGMYVAILNTLGPVAMAVTTNLNINFLRKPEPDMDLIGESWLMKVGKRLVIGEVAIFSEGEEDPVAHATSTYSIPPTEIEEIT